MYAKKTQFLLERILQRWISPWRELKRLLLAALTAWFSLTDVFIFERSREIDQKKKNSTDLALNRCHDKAIILNLARSVPYSLALTSNSMRIA